MIARFSKNILFITAESKVIFKKPIQFFFFSYSRLLRKFRSTSCAVDESADQLVHLFEISLALHLRLSLMCILLSVGCIGAWLTGVSYAANSTSQPVPVSYQESRPTGTWNDPPILKDKKKKVTSTTRLFPPKLYTMRDVGDKFSHHVHFLLPVIGCFEELQSILHWCCIHLGSMELVDKSLTFESSRVLSHWLQFQVESWVISKNRNTGALKFQIKNPLFKLIGHRHSQSTWWSI